MSPHEKSARGEIITHLICLPLINISPAPQQKFPHYRIVPQKSLPRPTIYLQKSAPPRRSPSGRIFTGKLSAREDFFLGGRSYNGAPASVASRLMTGSQHCDSVRMSGAALALLLLCRILMPNVRLFNTETRRARHTADDRPSVFPSLRRL